MEYPVLRTQLSIKSISQLEAPHGVMRSVLRWPTIGPLIGLAINFLEDAAQGTATYSASLSSHPTARHFKGQQLRRSPPRPATSN
jgi:hypothetical protein